VCSVVVALTVPQQRADVEGYSEVAAAFREVAASEEAQAMGHLEWLQEFGDPVSNEPMGSTKDNLTCAIAGESHDSEVL
jgi:rubrerythrin